MKCDICNDTKLVPGFLGVGIQVPCMCTKKLVPVVREDVDEALAKKKRFEAAMGCGITERRPLQSLNKPEYVSELAKLTDEIQQLREEMKAPISHRHDPLQHGVHFEDMFSMSETLHAGAQTMYEAGLDYSTYFKVSYLLIGSDDPRPLFLVRASIAGNWQGGNMYLPLGIPIPVSWGWFTIPALVGPLYLELKSDSPINQRFSLTFYGRTAAQLPSGEQLGC